MSIVGEWIFTATDPLNERTGYWSDIELQGTSKIGDNGLAITQGAWARCHGYKGAAIQQKTMVIWAQLKKPVPIRSQGSAMTLDSIGRDVYDAIDLGERPSPYWLPGSEAFRRTQDPTQSSAVETAFGNVVKIAISYADAPGGKGMVTMTRNGVEIAKYITGELPTWAPGDAEVIFGARPDPKVPQHDLHVWFDGTIRAAQLYDEALTTAQIADLIEPGTPGPYQSFTVIVPKDASTMLFLNVFAFFAGYLQRTTISCPELGYEKTFTSKGNSKNDRYGFDIANVQPGRPYRFKVAIWHTSNGKNWKSSNVVPARYTSAGVHKHITVLSEDATDKDFNDTVVTFDFFLPGRPALGT